MFTADDPLPDHVARPRRVVVAGTSGSGKTTLARRLGGVLGVEHVEMDSLAHGPDWTRRPTFAADVEAFTAGPAWVTEWQYTEVRALVASRAEVMVWIDHPYRVTLRRVVGRTLRRRIRREVLWNGNREPGLHTFLTDPENVVRWSIASRRRLETTVPAAAAAYPDLVVVRLRGQREVDRWVGRLAAALA